MKQIKQIIGFIKELRKTPRGKGILFFAFYFVVFAILFIILSIKEPTGLKEKDYELGTPYSFDINYVLNNNYHFEYTITKDSSKYVYVGDRYNDKMLFIFNNKEYSYDGDKYYLDNQEVDNPFLYSELLEFNNTKLLSEEATYDSKTSYNSGLTKYNFLLSSNTINSLIEDKETDIDEVPNTITISTDNGNIVDEVTYHLDSYCEYLNDCKNKLEINLTYSKFGEIKEIDK